ncbi:MAG TPA: 3-oxoacyl-ACP synthase III [Gemmataceae bacterium]|nr:3-oxoacyl-ACP synthase III [Gemmataceae bacterium]
MKYSRVFIDAIGYELPPEVVTTQELESRLRPVYQALHLAEGQLEALTGIIERRWWEPGYPLSRGAVQAARKALALSQVRPQDVDVLIYAAVCREEFEPATACRVAAELGINPETVYDISNACLGVLNGIVDIANRIELGQVRAGLVVSCETAREINDAMIETMLQTRNMDVFKKSLATLTGGSGAVAVLVTDGSFCPVPRRRILGGTMQAAPQYYGLCRWGLEGMLTALRQFTSTDSVAVLRYGVELGLRTWNAFLTRLGWAADTVDKVICHQVGASHRDSILKALGIAEEKEFSTYPFLGNMGTVSLPLTAALAEERDFLRPGDRVGFLGIGSGLNCLMLGVEW